MGILIANIMAAVGFTLGTIGVIVLQTKDEFLPPQVIEFNSNIQADTTLDSTWWAE